MAKEKSNRLATEGYVTREIQWLEKVTNKEFKSVRQAVVDAKASYEKRVAEAKSSYDSDKASSNEFRGQLKDQAATFVTRRELWSAVAIIIAIILGVMAYIK